MVNKQFDKDESLSKSVKQLVIKEAYYGLFLITMQKEWTDKIPSSGVGKNGINIMLYINELFWESLKEEWRLYVLKADVLHIVFHHIELGESLPEKDICLIAGNLVVNQYIDPSWIPLFNISYQDYKALNEELFELLMRDLEFKRKTKEEVVEELRKIPPRGVYIQDFPELKLEPLQGIKYYYDKLLEAKDKQPGQKGFCQALADARDQIARELPLSWIQDWSEFESMSEAEKKLFKAQIDYQMKEIADQVIKSRGTIPSELEGYIKALDKTEPPKFDWKRYLRRFTGGSQKTFTKKLHRKYNKRFEDNPGLKIKHKRHILVMIDISGSVSTDELKEFFHEIYHMHKMGSEITVLQCDAAISNIAPYKKGFEDQIKIYGRGGTEFTPAVDWYNEHLRKFSCAIYLTDGECPPPENKPKGRLLWVLSSKSNENNQLQPQIKLN